MNGIPAIPEHTIFLFLVQFGVILLVARTLGELAQRLGQPPVLGELLGGLLLGPSVLGIFAPDVQARLFPPDALGFHLLEMLSWLGMVLLLFIVGMEVDLKALRRLGRSSGMVTLFGFVITFISGWVLAQYLPGHLIGPLKDRWVLALFMGVAMSVTAVPVLAKILLDLDLMKRNFGITALGAGLVEDLIGWIMLSVVLDMARRGAGDPLSALRSLAVTLLFLGGAWAAGRPLVARLLRTVDASFRQGHRRVTAAVLVALACAATTQWIGIHAVYGAFIAGILVGQSSRFKPEDHSTLESMAFGIFSPVFFSFAGLQLRLHELREWDMLVVVLAVAVSGKLFGGYLGGRLGGFGRAESVALGVGMNARGAMELVLALLGLSAGIISSELYTIIVMMAVITTMMTPPLLRAVTRFIPLSADETERLKRQAQEARSIFAKVDMKALLPTSGGESALGLLALAAPLAAAKRIGLTAFMVREPGKSLQERFMRILGWDPATMDIRAAAEGLTRRAEGFGLALTPRVVTRASRQEAVLEEAERGYDLVLMGTHTPHDPLGGDFLSSVVGDSPCHAGVFKSVGAPSETPYRRILIPTKGDPLFPFVFEFAALYAETVPGVELTVLHALAGPGSAWNPLARLLGEAPQASEKGRLADLIGEAITAHTESHSTKLEVRRKVLEGPSTLDIILREARTGEHDLILMAGVKSLIRERLFFGHTIDELLRRSPLPTLVLTPARGGLGAPAR